MSSNPDQSLKPKEEISSMDNNMFEKACSLRELGLNEAFRKHYDKSIKLIEESQKIFLELKDLTQIASCLAELALIYYKKCNDRLIRALSLLNDARFLLEKQDKKDEIEAKILHYYGLINYYEKRFNESLKNYKKALALLKNDSLEYAKVLDSMSMYYLRINNYQIAGKYLNESLKIKREAGNKRELSITELLIGRYLSSVEDYEESANHLLVALDLVEKLGDLITVARIQDELAKIYINLEKYDLAEEFCNKSLNTSQNLDEPLVRIFSYCTLASLKIYRKNSDEALFLLKKEAEQQFIDLSETRGYAFTKKIAACAYCELGKTEEALGSIFEAIELFKETGINSEIARCYFELGNIYRKNGDITLAISSFLESSKIAKVSNLPLLAKKSEDLLFELDEGEWSNIINKTVKIEEIAPEEKSYVNVENLPLGARKNNYRDPLLALLRIGRSIAAETELDKLLEIIAEETKKVLNADRCTVFLLNKNTQELWSKVALGMGSQEIRFPAHMGLAGHVVITGETINIKDAYNDPRFNKEIDKKTGYITKTILCMPMRNLNHEIIGVFQVLNKVGKGYFSDEDEDLLIAIGSSAGIALENASLFKKQQMMYEEQKRSFTSFINTLAASIDARDKITAGHSKRVTGYAVAIAQQIGMPAQSVEVIEYAATLHDIGKIGIKDSVLCKEGKLTDEEYRHIQEHAFITDVILKQMFFEEKFKAVPEIASSHHEKYDGTGYFKKIKGEEIPLGGRILAVSDVFDAITSKRHYRDRMSIIQVLNILRKDSGKHFDGAIVDEFLKISIEKILNVLLSGNDKPLDNEAKAFFRNYSMNDLHNMLLKDESDRTDDEKQLISIFQKYYDSKEEN